MADYTVSITGSGQGTITSNPGHLTFIPDRVPGLFDTGMGEHCTVLADGLADPHYLILTNPDGDSLIPAVVEDSTAFPIVTGPWVQNTAVSKWVGPRFNTAGAAGEGVDNGAGPGVYVYQTTFDLTGFDLSSVRITGGWATDNLGVKVLVNGHDVGLTNTAQFPSLTPFLITGAANFVAGANTLEFWVQNQGAGVGYTGLRVDGLQGFGNVLANTPPHIAVNPVGAVVQPNDTICLSVSASGSAPLAYQWYLGNTLLTGETAATIMVNVDSIAKLGDYKVVVSNGTSPNATSSIATLTYNPTFSGYSFNAIKDTPASVGIAKILAAATDADNGTLALSAVSATSSQGGAVAIAGSKVTYNPPAGYTGGDSFSVTIVDGQGGSVTGTVIITVGAGSGPSLNQAVLTVLPGGNVSVVFMGIPGQSYQIQRSADLLNWTTMQTSTAAADGQLPYLDTSPLSGTGFYRTKIP